MTVTEPLEQAVGFVGRIPVRNLWLLLLYASRMLRELSPAQRNVEENPEAIPNLVAELLARRVERRLRRCLTLAYIEERAVLNRVRGRIDHLSTERHRLLQRGKIACRYHKLDVNTVANRYVRAALETSGTLVSDRDLAHRCRALAGAMRSSGVIGERPTRAEMSAYRSTPCDRDDQAMLAVARLVFDLALPNEMAGGHPSSELDRGDYVRNLFEKAVGGFYDVVLAPKGWQVWTSTKLSWPVEVQSIGMGRVLPGMEIDIGLEDPQRTRRIIIDTKFTTVLAPGQFGGQSLSSAYIYQIYAYLRSQEGTDDLSGTAAGLMLHPAVETTVDEWVVVQGHMIRFATVDLAAPAVEIRSQLLDRIDCPVVG